jgi:hypothetical protein
LPASAAWLNIFPSGLSSSCIAGMSDYRYSMTMTIGDNSYNYIGTGTAIAFTVDGDIKAVARNTFNVGTNKWYGVVFTAPLN